MSGIIRSDAGLDSYQYVLSRTVKVPHSAPSPTVIKCLQSNQLTDWDLVITETSGTTNIKITLTISNENGSYSIIQPIGFGVGGNIKVLVLYWSKRRRLTPQPGL